MLLNAADPEVLREKMAENETIMKEMSLTWEEKLQKTGVLIKLYQYDPNILRSN